MPVTDSQVRDYILANPKESQGNIKRKFGIGTARCKRLIEGRERAYEKQSGQISSPTVGLNVECDQNNLTVNGYLSKSVKTLDELLKTVEVDLSVWEVDRWYAKKWQGFNRDIKKDMTWKDGRATGSDSQNPKPIVTDLWQVFASFKRRAAVFTASEEALAKIRAGSPFSGTIKHKKIKGAIHRSLEVDIMDPHIGLYVDYPEGDAPQDLDSIGKLILDAIDSLLSRAKPFGPFEQVFIPFGNDFTHVDTVFHTTTAGTGQPEAVAWHKAYVRAQEIAVDMVERLRKVAPVYIYEIPGNHSRMADFTLARIIQAYFHACKDVHVDASSSPYKFHRYGASLIGFEHGHSVKPIRLAALMANERKDDWQATEYREWHLGDQHRKGSSKPSMLEEQGVSVEYIPGLTAPNEWHRLKSFSHQKRGAMAFVYDFKQGPIARLQHNISQYSHKPLGAK